MYSVVYTDDFFVSFVETASGPVAQTALALTLKFRLASKSLVLSRLS